MPENPRRAIGRDGEIREVAKALSSTGDGSRILLVTADAGTGKTTVVEQARRTAVRHGVAVVRLGWERAEDTTDVPLVAEARCGLVIEDPDGCLPPLPAVLRARPGGTAWDGEMTGLAALGEALAQAARHHPFALLTDGVERMPRHIAEALGVLLRVFRPRGVPVVMAGRPVPAADAVRSWLTAAADRVLELPPLRPADAAALVTARVGGRFGRPAEPALADAVSRALGPLAGNPRAVLSVLGSLDERSLLELDGLLCLAVPENRLRLTTEPAELLPSGWPGTPADPGIAEAAIFTARVLEHAEVRIEDVVRLTPPAAARSIEHGLDRLVADRVLEADDQGRMSFVVPALAEALRTLPAGRDMQAAHARFVTRFVTAVTDRLGVEGTGSGYPMLADHVAAAGPLLDDTLAVPLLLAAAREDARVDWPRSVRAYASVLRRLPPEDRRTLGVLREASALSLRHGDHSGLLALGEPLLARLAAARAEHPTDVAAVVCASVWAALHEHRSPYADDTDVRYRAVLERAPAAAGLAALGGLYGIGPVTPRPAPAANPAAVTAPGHPGGSVPTPAELDLVAAAVGGAAELRQARRRLPPDALDEPALNRLHDAAAYADLAGALAAVLGDRYAPAQDSVAVRYRTMVRDYLAGNWDAALATARRIEVRSRSGGTAGAAQSARALAAEIHCMRGNVESARSWLELIPDTVVHPLAARARLLVLCGSGRAEEALERAWRDVRLARRGGRLAGLERVLLRVLSFAALHGRPRTVHQALNALEELHIETASRMTHEAVLIARAITHHDADSARAAHGLLERRGDVHLAVICSLCLAHLDDDPRPWLAEAARTAQGLGLGQMFRSEITRTAQRRGVPLPRLRQAREELTPLEVELLRMVSDGATNRQIAAALACSEKTVEQRLTRLFRRTGCRSRAELAAAWLDGGLSPASGTAQNVTSECHSEGC
ncbi:LuxR family transcriptional regulator [Streptomyces sp. NPDC050263]|uniref:helix-turn-helix transcriptional regulator n=1 Tax=Streptomyces sp. NPDC050263 TaxID=3155037 RepID=UPI00343988CF